MEATTPDDLKRAIESGAGVFLKLWKPGCGACKLSESATDRLEKTYQDSVRFVSISAEDYPEMYDIADTDVLPVFFLFKDKAKQGKVIGFKGIKPLSELLEEAFGSKQNQG